MTVKGSLLEKRSTFGRLLALFTNTLNNILLHFVCLALLLSPCNQLTSSGELITNRRANKVLPVEVPLPCAAPLALRRVGY